MSSIHRSINQFQRQLTNAGWLVESWFTSEHTDQLQPLKGSNTIHDQV